MAQPTRLAVLTVALVAGGAVIGAACGVLALGPAWASNRLHPTADDTFILWYEIAGWAATAGAMVGAVLGPTLALSLLRRSPLWRVLVEPAAGTVVGSTAGWLLGSSGVVATLPALGVGALLGTLVAALRLRRSAQRTQAALSAPLPNDR